MKKISCLIACLPIVFGLVSCIGKNEETQTKAQKTKAHVTKKYTPPKMTDLVANSTVDPVLKQKREQAEMARKMRQQMGLPPQ